jgi:5'-nucleotidase
MLEILLTNDDGYDSVGILALKSVLSDIANITIIAPSKDKSACSHSLSLTSPLKLDEIDENYYKLDDGTPADCVFLGFSKILKKKPDLVISGINLGANLGEDTTYSGTIAGAFEASLKGVKAIALSQVFKENYKKKEYRANFDFEIVKKYIYDIVKKITNNKYKNEFSFLNNRQILNINFPSGKLSKCKGYKSTRLGSRLYANEAQEGINPRGEKYFWLGLHKPKELKTKHEIISDIEAIRQKYISITPLQLDKTNYSQIKNIDNMF